VISIKKGDSIRIAMNAKLKSNMGFRTFLYII